MWKRSLTALLVSTCFTFFPAQAVDAPAATVLLAWEAPNGEFLEEVPIYENTTYVPLRRVTEAMCPEVQVSWEDGAAQLSSDGFSLVARPGESTLTCNGIPMELSAGVQLVEGHIFVPVRALAAALDLCVDWDAAAGQVTLAGGPQEDEDLYWLARIISAESKGEPLAGKVAVGNVVLNRVADEDFPDSIYDVVFDDRWGGQFEPVRNKTIYQEPTDESVFAARLCLAGANTAENSLYFLAPALTDNHWTMHNRTYVATIGAHWFYQ